MMSTTYEERPSAKIYQFPVRHRTQMAKVQEQARPQGSTATAKVAAAALDGAWYHEAAVEKTEAGLRH